MSYVADEPQSSLAPSSYEAVVSGILTASHRLHPEQVAPLLASRLALLGMRDVAVYLADVDQRDLVALGGYGIPVRPSLGIDSTLAGRCFRREEITSARGGVGEAESSEPGGHRLWVPMIDGSERLGVLGVTVDKIDDVTLRRLGDAASLAAALVVSKMPYGDHILRTRRTKPMNLAAEMRWDQLPALTYVNPQVALSGLLEPAYHVAGDAFDYAINGDTTEILILDAMGHGLEASRMATLAVATYRNSRRQGADLQATFRTMDQVVSAEFGPEKFVTAQLGMLDTAHGRLRWINAGHPPPILLRHHSMIGVQCTTCLPIGMGDEPSASADIILEPGDTVLFFTDGIIEARSASGEEFGRERLGDMLVRNGAAGTTIAETVRRLCRGVLAHQDGVLQDDATLLLLRWFGPQLSLSAVL